jgi:hypothetical protein
MLRAVEFPNGSHKFIHDTLFDTARCIFSATLQGPTGDGDDVPKNSPKFDNYMGILEKLLRIRQACCSGELVPLERPTTRWMHEPTSRPTPDPATRLAHSPTTRWMHEPTSRPTPDPTMRPKPEHITRRSLIQRLDRHISQHPDRRISQHPDRHLSE